MTTTAAAPRLTPEHRAFIDRDRREREQVVLSILQEERLLRGAWGSESRTAARIAKTEKWVRRLARREGM